MGVKGGLTVLSNFEFLQGVIVRLMRAAGFLVLLCYFCVFPGQYLISGGRQGDLSIFLFNSGFLQGVIVCLMGTAGLRV